jgi:glycosyltransferase involved in cell wall biosynthesis
MYQRGVDPKRLAVLPPGVDTGSVPDVRRTRKPCIVCVGRLEHVKGHDVLLKAFADFVCLERFSAWRLLLVGCGRRRRQLARLARDLDLGERCLFVGESPHDEVWRLLCTASLFVLPSRAEAMPLSLIEAMKCGVPCIATAVGGVPEVIRHGDTGWLIAPDDRPALARAFVELASDAVRASALGEAGRRSVEQKYDMKCYIERIEKVYNDNDDISLDQDGSCIQPPQTLSCGSSGAPPERAEPPS